MRVAVAVVVVVAAWLFLPDGDSVRGSWWSVLPPTLAIVLALVARQVVASLFLGIWLGTTILAGDPVTGMLRLVDTNIRESLADSDHVSILVFSLLLGGMVGVMSRGGGTSGVVRKLEPLATTPRRAQFATWLMEHDYSTDVTAIALIRIKLTTRMGTSGLASAVIIV